MRDNMATTSTYNFKNAFLHTLLSSMTSAKSVRS